MDIVQKIKMEPDDEEREVYQQPDDQFAQGFSIMEEIRREGKMCDVTIKVDDQCFSAHRIVLASTIPYFHAMFTHDMVESKQRDISIQGIDSQAMEVLINFAYSGKVIIDNNNVQSLMVGASFLQLQKVRDACASYLMNRLHPQNALGVRNFADSLACITLVQAADKFVQHHFAEVSVTAEYLSLEVNEVSELISSDKLHVASEETVFEAVIRWVKRDASTRVQHLPQMLSLVRLPLLTPHYLTDRVATEELVRSSLKCRDLLDEARDYHLLPERRGLVQSFRTRMRSCHCVVGHIFAVGGLTKSGDSLSTVEVFDPVSSRWSQAEPMSMLRSRVGVAVMRGKLYAIGGYNGAERLSTVEVFDPQQRTWSRVAPMHFKRSAVGAAALGDRLYVCGGYDGITSLSTVECYHPDHDVWKLVTEMTKHRSAGGVVAFEGHIYALGGHDGLSIFDSVERYSPHTDQWSPVTPMKTQRCRLGVAALDSKLYVCGGYDGSTFLETVEEYDPVKNQWRFVAPMNVMRSRVALVANAGKLWAIGGYDGVSNLSTVECYDPEKNTWSFVASMCAHEGGVGVGVIPMGSSSLSQPWSTNL